jgi:hypothetical protein
VEKDMDLQIKVFRWPNQANHVIMLARGTLDLEGFKQMFSQLSEMSGPLVDCKILIDLLDARCKLGAGDIDKVLSGLNSDRLSQGSKIALIFSRVNKDYDALSTISASLSKRGFKAAVFENSDVAADWLVDKV